MARNGGNGDRGRNADEDQKRRHQESAADPEHAGHETNGRAHRKDEKNIDRDVGDRKVKLHARSLLGVGPEPSRNRSRHGISMHGVDHQFERGIYNRACFFWIEILQQLHRSLDVGEQRRDGLALAVEGCSGVCSRRNNVWT